MYGIRFNANCSLSVNPMLWHRTGLTLSYPFFR